MVLTYITTNMRGLPGPTYSARWYEVGGVLLELNSMEPYRAIARRLSRYSDGSA